MGATENRQLMTEIFEGLSVGDGRRLIAAMAEDFCWTIIGTTSWSGSYRGKATVQARLLQPLVAQFAQGSRHLLDRIIAEGDRVVVECRGAVTTKRGKAYDNTYCWVCRIAEGKLVELTEYMDTALVETALEPPNAA
jgi:ketosteroid isomerase-like protein